MSEREQKVFDKGPWRVVTGEGRAVGLESNDFGCDAMLSIGGDFGSLDKKIAYGNYLARILTAGCAREQASRDLVDEQGLLEALSKAARTPGPAAELLQMAADEVARLRVELAEALNMLQTTSASKWALYKSAQVAEKGPLELAMEKALKARQQAK